MLLGNHLKTILNEMLIFSSWNTWKIINDLEESCQHIITYIHYTFQYMTWAALFCVFFPKTFGLKQESYNENEKSHSFGNN